MKRSPLKRGKPLARGTSQLKRTRMKQVSDKRRVENEGRGVVRAEVFRRDRCCLLKDWPDEPFKHDCQTVLTPHHLLKSSGGGKYELSNLVAMCAQANSMIEDHPAAAWAIGLVCRRGDTLEDCYERMRQAGIRTPLAMK